MSSMSEVYSEHSKISKLKLLAKNVDRFQLFTICALSFILDV